MENNNLIRKSEVFVKRVVFTSLILTLIISNIAILICSNLDAIKSYLVSYYIEEGDYDRALEINSTISDSDLQLNGKYTAAQNLYSECSYSDALQLFSELDSYKDSDEYCLKISYEMADELYSQGLYDDALDAFTLLGDYSDCADRCLKIKYEIAQQTYESGDYSKAVLLFLDLGDYADCADKAFKAALDLTGDKDLAEEMLYSDGLTADGLSESLQIAERRSIFPNKVIDAGAYHTVLLHSDGTVSAVGDNTYGQCNVEDWTDIITVSAGAYHTVGLKSDGTVLAVGKNTHGQCSVSKWTNITSIAAGDSDTYGLTSKGTVKYCGYHNYSNIKKASNVTDIYAGSYAAVAMLSSGSFSPSHKTYSIKAEREVISVALNTGYIIALQSDGSCISKLDAVSEWKNIVYIDAGSTAIVAVDANGNVQSHFFRKKSAVDFSSVNDACQCAAGAGHFVFLNADGTVTALGDNSHGQCDTAALGNAA